MTQEEKLKEAKILYKDANADQRYVLERLFPELTESVDERIRKELIAHCENLSEMFHIIDKKEDFVKYQSWINWLEKQGQTFTEKDVDDAYLKGVCDTKQELEKQGEQKPTQEIEPTPIFRIGNILKRKGKDYTFRVDRIQGGYYHCDRNHGAFFPIEEQDNWELVEQKPAWSEEDKGVLLESISVLQSSSHWVLADKLKSLKDRVGNFDHGYKVGFSAAKHNQWKPSDVQMRILSIYADQNNTHGSVLTSLYHDLKKLNEE